MQVCAVKMARWDHKVLKERLARKEKQEQQVQRAHRVLKVLKDPKARKVLKGSKVKRDQQVFKALLV